MQWADSYRTLRVRTNADTPHDAKMSVEFCHNVKMTYVSCSPYRVPIARLAAAHAKLKEK